jgi:hypothetical protein
VPSHLHALNTAGLQTQRAECSSTMRPPIHSPERPLTGAVNFMHSVCPSIMSLRALFLCIFLVLWESSASVLATTLIEPDLDQLIEHAEDVFVGDVKEVESRWVGAADARHIATFVMFDIVDSLKGEARGNYTLQVYGGTVGDESSGVSDAPRFRVGERRLLFIAGNGRRIVPVIGFNHGAFHILEGENGKAVIERSEGGGCMIDADDAKAIPSAAAQFHAGSRNYEKPSRTRLRLPARTDAREFAELIRRKAQPKASR